ncbi:hypothetical protein AXG93_2091s1000 [Marchantia polymorpha subsp. ruderalis]|uniref:Rhamnogalacturonan lyase domain-containing protein n=1 Tax=Marchantia polymorpha subsp. ruderalis TaxID=1480154 RepID=A0A176W6S4_MARPO|nr:hypothetical protein AXG93_2091s1000 [Marchantia polymorpha subsp. ruderalis]
MAPDVTYTSTSSKVVMDNGYVQVTISRPGGHVTGIKYGGMDNVLESTNSETNRGYWDLNWNDVDGSDTYDAPSATQYKVVESNGDKVELSFTRPYDSSRSPAMVPLTIDKRDALVGLAKPGAAGSWQKESKGYQFWVQADQDGNFTINHDLVYTVGTSDYKKDWYFAHNTRRHSDGTYTATRWQIKFELSSFDESKGAYKLRMAIAQAQVSAIQVRVNDVSSKPVYETPAFGKDNAIARHGIQGIYVLYNIDIPAADLKKGNNSIYLTQRKASGPYMGLCTTICAWKHHQANM